MHILSGPYKGKKIETSLKAQYRPTKSIVRKSLFDILGPLNGHSFLDLFSGSGIIGFEALSRGASHIHFVESNHYHIQMLKTNSGFFPDKIHIHHQDVFKYLNTVSQSFDIIFADPPYNGIDIYPLIESSIQLLNSKGIFILEVNRSNRKLLHDPKIRNYGKTQLAFWKNK
ncbi:MAG: methyltransferase [Candidatus Marinimicrobia bacterium]|jgi:16S rRNA (guanine966-N2)-methyltransferase|nr:methyltransferase [Candidatus Neomarinimicrobiota bacterium]MBT3937093.1 methyltransferase [Candidatus Neomarinimicrobiota bacterium]MBT3962063.1 methyltransferase [Candidatus Neomarinimicrobiota bacterium]MBT4382431.1 methyltransferase [Candidatus Neomarinimicrobiota bacterium]MBT4636548.1 methyltransferase [Candidatus Neomarinimicrobiota bacterium]